MVMTKPTTVLAEGLGHPEGPDFLADGGLVFVETFTGRIAVYREGEGVSTFANCQGGPNACMLGSDGCVYITQNGGTVGAWVSDDRVAPSIQRTTPDGSRVDIICTEVDGIALNAPNDLTWSPDGRLYFTDSGVWDDATRPDPGYVFALSPDGGSEVVLDLGNVYPNGITCEADGSIVWVESYTRKVARRRTDGSVEELCILDEGHVPDGLKVAADGNLWITAFGAGGVDVVAPDGSHVAFLETGGVPLNCVFRDGALYITDNGTADTSGPAPMTGRLVRADVGVAGLPLFRGAIAIS
jgi:gluconolactonase